MELKNFSEELLKRMKGEVEQINIAQPDVLLRTSQIISCIESLVLELKLYVVKYRFINNSEEIEFFKTIKPIFISQLWFHRKLFNIRLFESFSDTKSRLRFYQRILKSLQNVMLKQKEFYHYALSNADHMDEKYFLRANAAKRSLLLDERFSTVYDDRLSKILANELVKDYALTSIQKIKFPSSINEATSSLTWTGSKTDLIELIYALQATRVFNKESADVKQIATHFESVFNISLGSYYRVFQEIKLRKSGQTNFLDELRRNLKSKIDEAT